jgi:hypothetical protein
MEAARAQLLLVWEVRCAVIVESRTMMDLDAFHPFSESSENTVSHDSHIALPRDGEVL